MGNGSWLRGHIVRNTDSPGQGLPSQFPGQFMDGVGTLTNRSSLLWRAALPLPGEEIQLLQGVGRLLGQQQACWMATRWRC